jgi:hypothetical protein
MKIEIFERIRKTTKSKINGFFFKSHSQIKNLIDLPNTLNFRLQYKQDQSGIRFYVSVTVQAI